MQAQAFMQQFGTIRELRRQLEAKNAALKSLARIVAGGLAAPMAQTVALDAESENWENLLEGLTAFEASLEHQKQELLQQVHGNIARFMQKIEAAMFKWAEIKPSGVPLLANML
jgi:hypothetical protein